MAGRKSVLVNIPCMCKNKVAAVFHRQCRLQSQRNKLAWPGLAGEGAGGTLRVYNNTVHRSLLHRRHIWKYRQSRHSLARGSRGVLGCRETPQVQACCCLSCYSTPCGAAAIRNDLFYTSQDKTMSRKAALTIQWKRGVVSSQVHLAEALETPAPWDVGKDEES